MKMTEVDKDMSGGGRKKALCMTAGVAAAVLGTVGALLAVACGIALFIWGVSNYGQEIGSVMTAVVAGASAGALAAIPSAILAIVSWYLMGEPISRRCRERAEWPGTNREERPGRTKGARNRDLNRRCHWHRRYVHLPGGNPGKRHEHAERNRAVRSYSGSSRRGRPGNRSSVNLIRDEMT